MSRGGRFRHPAYRGTSTSLWVAEPRAAGATGDVQDAQVPRSQGREGAAELLHAADNGRFGTAPRARRQHKC